jgi:hypothetical protein|tara:strand:+ start:102 stop:464 length:363 start_codon:yes stop_codon:yes gene_type:complete
MRKIGLIMVFSLTFGTEPKSLDRLVYEHLLVAQIEMKSSPMVGQDLREGYLRGKAIRITDLLMDSLGVDLTGLEIIGNHIPDLHELIDEVYDGKEYHLDLGAPTVKQNVNYFDSFSSSNN